MTHEPMCPCNKADERGCFLISAETGKCISCVCGDKMGAYLDGYAAALHDAINAIKSREDGDYFPWPQVLIATAAIHDLQP